MKLSDVSENFNDVLSWPNKFSYELVKNSNNLSKDSEYLLSWIVSTVGARIAFSVAAVCSIAKIAFNLFFTIGFLFYNLWTWTNGGYENLTCSSKALLCSLRDLGLELTGAVISPSLSNYLNKASVSTVLKIIFNHAKLIIFAIGLWTILQPIFATYKYIMAII